MNPITSVVNCSACHAPHTGLPVVKLPDIVTLFGRQYTHIAKCPNTRTDIYIRENGEELAKVQPLSLAELMELRESINGGVHAPDSLIARLCARVDLEISRYNKWEMHRMNEVGQLQDGLYVPNEKHCPLCGFVAGTGKISAATGSVTTAEGSAPTIDICPNDGTLLYRQTWREALSEARRDAIALREQMGER